MDDMEKVRQVRSLIERLKEQRGEVEKLELALADALIRNVGNSKMLDRIHGVMVASYNERFALEQQIRQRLVDFLKENRVSFP